MFGALQKINFAVAIGSHFEKDLITSEPYLLWILARADSDLLFFFVFRRQFGVL